MNPAGAFVVDPDTQHLYAAYGRGNIPQLERQKLMTGEYKRISYDTDTSKETRTENHGRFSHAQRAREQEYPSTTQSVLKSIAKPDVGSFCREGGHDKESHAQASCTCKAKESNDRPPVGVPRCGVPLTLLLPLDKKYSGTFLWSIFALGKLKRSLVSRKRVKAPGGEVAKESPPPVKGSSRCKALGESAPRCRTGRGHKQSRRVWCSTTRLANGCTESPAAHHIGYHYK